MKSELFVANLDWSATEEELTELFTKAGQVESLRIPTDRYTGRKRGFAFIQMSSPEAASQAIAMLNDWSFKGRNLVVKFSESREGGGGFSGQRQQRDVGYSRY